MKYFVKKDKELYVVVDMIINQPVASFADESDVHKFIQSLISLPKRANPVNYLNKKFPGKMDQTNLKQQIQPQPNVIPNNFSQPKPIQGQFAGFEKERIDENYIRRIVAEMQRDVLAQQVQNNVSRQEPIYIPQPVNIIQGEQSYPYLTPKEPEQFRQQPRAENHRSGYIQDEPRKKINQDQYYGGLEQNPFNKAQEPEGYGSSYNNPSSYQGKYKNFEQARSNQRPSERWKGFIEDEHWESEDQNSWFEEGNKKTRPFNKQQDVKDESNYQGRDFYDDNQSGYSQRKATQNQIPEDAYDAKQNKNYQDQGNKFNNYKNDLDDYESNFSLAQNSQRYENKEKQQKFRENNKDVNNNQNQLQTKHFGEQKLDEEQTFKKDAIEFQKPEQNFRPNPNNYDNQFENQRNQEVQNKNNDINSWTKPEGYYNKDVNKQNPNNYENQQNIKNNDDQFSNSSKAIKNDEGNFYSIEDFNAAKEHEKNQRNESYENSYLENQDNKNPAVYNQELKGDKNTQRDHQPQSFEKPESRLNKDNYEAQKPEQNFSPNPNNYENQMASQKDSEIQSKNAGHNLGNKPESYLNNKDQVEQKPNNYNEPQIYKTPNEEFVDGESKAKKSDSNFLPAQNQDAYKNGDSTRQNRPEANQDVIPNNLKTTQPYDNQVNKPEVEQDNFKNSLKTEPSHQPQPNNYEQKQNSDSKISKPANNEPNFSSAQNANQVEANENQELKAKELFNQNNQQNEETNTGLENSKEQDLRDEERSKAPGFADKGNDQKETTDLSSVADQTSSKSDGNQQTPNEMHDDSKQSYPNKNQIKKHGDNLDTDQKPEEEASLNTDYVESALNEKDMSPAANEIKTEVKPELRDENDEAQDVGDTVPDIFEGLKALNDKPTEDYNFAKKQKNYDNYDEKAKEEDLKYNENFKKNLESVAASKKSNKKEFEEPSTKNELSTKELEDNKMHSQDKGFDITSESELYDDYYNTKPQPDDFDQTAEMSQDEKEHKLKKAPTQPLEEIFVDKKNEENSVGETKNQLDSNHKNLQSSSEIENKDADSLQSDLSNMNQEKQTSNTQPQGRFFSDPKTNESLKDTSANKAVLDQDQEIKNDLADLVSAANLEEEANPNPQTSHPSEVDQSFDAKQQQINDDLQALMNEANLDESNKNQQQQNQVSATQPHGEDFSGINNNSNTSKTQPNLNQQQPYDLVELIKDKNGVGFSDSNEESYDSDNSNIDNVESVVDNNSYNDQERMLKTNKPKESAKQNQNQQIDDDLQALMNEANLDELNKKDQPQTSSTQPIGEDFSGANNNLDTSKTQPHQPKNIAEELNNESDQVSSQGNNPYENTNSNEVFNPEQVVEDGKSDSFEDKQKRNLPNDQIKPNSDQQQINDDLQALMNEANLGESNKNQQQQNPISPTQPIGEVFSDQKNLGDTNSEQPDESKQDISKASDQKLNQESNSDKNGEKSDFIKPELLNETQSNYNQQLDDDLQALMNEANLDEDGQYQNSASPTQPNDKDYEISNNNSDTSKTQPGLNQQPAFDSADLINKENGSGLTDPNLKNHDLDSSNPNHTKRVMDNNSYDEQSGLTQTEELNDNEGQHQKINTDPQALMNEVDEQNQTDYKGPEVSLATQPQTKDLNKIVNGLEEQDEKAQQFEKAIKNNNVDTQATHKQQEDDGDEGQTYSPNHPQPLVKRINNDVKNSANAPYKFGADNYEPDIFENQMLFGGIMKFYNNGDDDSLGEMAAFKESKKVNFEHKPQPILKREQPVVKPEIVKPQPQVVSSVTQTINPYQELLTPGPTKTKTAVFTPKSNPGNVLDLGPIEEEDDIFSTPRADKSVDEEEKLTKEELKALKKIKRAQEIRRRRR